MYCTGREVKIRIRKNATVRVETSVFDDDEYPVRFEVSILGMISEAEIIDACKTELAKEFAFYGLGVEGLNFVLV